MIFWNFILFACSVRRCVIGPFFLFVYFSLRSTGRNYHPSTRPSSSVFFLERTLSFLPFLSLLWMNFYIEVRHLIRLEEEHGIR